MAGMLKPGQSIGPKRWKGLQTKNSLAALCMHSQQQASENIVRLMAWKYGNTLDTLLSKLPTKKFPTDDEYVWYIQGPHNKNYQLLEARTLDNTVIDSTTGMIGANQEPFYLVFGEDWTWRGATIVGNLNEVYQFVVLDEPKYEGGNTVYRVYLSGANTNGIPAKRLLAGERFSFEANYVENGLDREVGDLSGATNAKMRNEFSTIRTKYKVDGAMSYDKLACGVQVEDENGRIKTYDAWMPYVDFLFERDFRDQKNRALAYGKSNRNENGEYMDFGPSGKAIRKSAGLYQQLEYGNVRYTNGFSLRVLEQSLLDLMSGKVDYANRHVTITTGDAGMMDFHKAVLQETQGWTNLTLDNSSVNMIQKVNSPYHQNALSAGFQFTQFRSPMGIVIDVMVDQSYNDPVRNKVRLSDGTLAYSHRMDIMDLGSGSEQNIFKCEVEAYPEVRGYQAGPFGNPFTGEVGNNHASYDENSAVAHKRAVLGVCVLDPTRCISLIPDALAE